MNGISQCFPLGGNLFLVFFISLLSILDSRPQSFMALSPSKMCSQRNNTWPSNVPCSTPTKKYKMAMLVLWNGFADLFEDDFECLKIAMEIMAVLVNAKQNVLSDYELELIYYNGPVGYWLTPQVVLEFFQNAQLRAISKNETDVFISPTIIGPQLDLNNDYQPMSNFIYENYHMPALIRAYNFGQLYARTGQILGVKVEDGLTFFSPIYNVASDFSSLKKQDEFKVPILSFAPKTFLANANWKEVGLVIDTVSNNDPGGLASELSRTLSPFGIKVIQTEIGSDFFEMFSAIAKSRARIIYSLIKGEQCFKCSNLWCSMHKAGIRAAKYVILMEGAACLQCLNTFSNNTFLDDSRRRVEKCSLEKQIETVKAALFFDSFGNLPRPPRAGRLQDFKGRAAEFIERERNQDRQTFDGTMLAATSNQCHLFSERQLRLYTELLAAVWLLNETETELSKFNSSLRDYIPMKGLAPSDQIIKTERQLAINAEYRGLPWQSTYDDYFYYYAYQAEPQTIKTHENSTSKLEFKPRFIAKMSAFNGFDFIPYISKHNITSIEKPNWATNNGQAPKDLSRVLRKNGTYNVLAFTTISVFAGLIIMTQLFFVFKSRTAIRILVKNYFDFEANVTMLISCFILDVSSIVFLVGTIYFPVPACHIGIALTIIGLAALNGTIFAKCNSLLKFLHLNRYIISKKRTPNLFNLDFHEQQREKDMGRLGKKRKIIVGIISLASSALLIIWFASDPFILRTEVAYDNDPPYDDELDTFYDVEFDFCYSVSQIYWISIFTAFHAFMLFYGCFLVFSVNKIKLKMIRARFVLEVKQLRLVTVNAITLLLFALLAINILRPSAPSVHSYLQLAAFTSGQLVYSLFTSLILYVPLLKRESTTK